LTVLLFPPPAAAAVIMIADHKRHAHTHGDPHSDHQPEEKYRTARISMYSWIRTCIHGIQSSRLKGPANSTIKNCMAKKTNTLKRTGGCGETPDGLCISHAASVKITVSTGNAYKIDFRTIGENGIAEKRRGQNRRGRGKRGTDRPTGRQ
jgi:hypothetical protein